MGGRTEKDIVKREGRKRKRRAAAGAGGVGGEKKGPGRKIKGAARWWGHPPLPRR